MMTRGIVPPGAPVPFHPHQGARMQRAIRHLLLAALLVLLLRDRQSPVAGQPAADHQFADQARDERGQGQSLEDQARQLAPTEEVD